MKSINRFPYLLLISLLVLPAATHAQVQSSSGTKLVASGPLRLVFQDAGLINHGEFVAGNSTVQFIGSASPSFISGSRPLAFHNLVISMDEHELVLNSNLRITGTLTMDKGNLRLNGYQLDLGLTGNVYGERNASRITGNNGGTIKALALLNAPRAANPGNIGLEITSPANLGETIIIRGHSSGFTAGGRPHIQRYYDIQPQHNTDLRASLKLYYFDAELNSEEGALTVFSAKRQQGNWLEMRKDNMDAGNNWIVKNELDQLHRFTLAGATNRALAQAPGNTSVHLFPNPTRDQFTILLNTAGEIETAVNLYDQLGRLMESKRIICRAGTNTIVWNVGQYATGSYYLSFESLGLKMVKIVKQ